MAYKLLIINPGSTSTKIGVYLDEKEILVETLRHSSDEISKYNSIYDQKKFRKDVIIDILKKNNIDLNSLNAVVGRGGMLRPIPGGTYEVTNDLLNDLKVGVSGQHASNLGGILAREIADEIGIRSFIVDPVVVDELQEVARISGIPELPRRSIFHALNQKAVAKRYAKEKRKKYEDLNLIVAHMGGGISVGAHRQGRVVDVNNALDGEGPFSPERSGGLPMFDVIKMCYDQGQSYHSMMTMVKRKGGLMAHLGTTDSREAEKMIQDGDEHAKLIYDAMALNVAKNIAKCAPGVCGRVDAILLTGGIAHNKRLTDFIAAHVDFIAPVFVYPGENELEALARNALAVLRGDCAVKTYYKETATA